MRYIDAYMFIKRAADSKGTDHLLESPRRDGDNAPRRIPKPITSPDDPRIQRIMSGDEEDIWSKVKYPSEGARRDGDNAPRRIPKPITSPDDPRIQRIMSGAADVEPVKIKYPLESPRRAGDTAPRPSPRPVTTPTASRVISALREGDTGLGRRHPKPILLDDVGGTARKVLDIPKPGIGMKVKKGPTRLPTVPMPISPAKSAGFWETLKDIFRSLGKKKIKHI